LTTQQLTTKTLPSTDAFGKLLGAHATLTRELSATLLSSHGLTINDYGCLLLLSRADENGMRRIDLANDLQLSPSGITRLLDRLEDQGLVEKGECESDARVSYALLTDDGLAKLREAAPGHVEDIELATVPLTRFQVRNSGASAGVTVRLAPDDPDSVEIRFFDADGVDDDPFPSRRRARGRQRQRRVRPRGRAQAHRGGG